MQTLEDLYQPAPWSEHPIIKKDSQDKSHDLPHNLYIICASKWRLSLKPLCSTWKVKCEPLPISRVNEKQKRVRTLLKDPSDLAEGQVLIYEQTFSNMNIVINSTPKVTFKLSLRCMPFLCWTLSYWDCGGCNIFIWSLFSLSWEKVASLHNLSTFAMPTPQMTLYSNKTFLKYWALLRFNLIWTVPAICDLCTLYSFQLCKYSVLLHEYSYDTCNRNIQCYLLPEY